jgi:glycine/D-amino acid oxidase-like deaminating enzyme
MADLPKHARVVVIGQGGIVGASVVHHLIEEGWDDIVGLEKSDRRRMRLISAI